MCGLLFYLSAFIAWNSGPHVVFKAVRVEHNYIDRFLAPGSVSCMKRRPIMPCRKSGLPSSCLIPSKGLNLTIISLVSYAFFFFKSLLWLIKYSYIIISNSYYMNLSQTFKSSEVMKNVLLLINSLFSFINDLKVLSRRSCVISYLPSLFLRTSFV